MSISGESENILFMWAVTDLSNRWFWGRKQANTVWERILTFIKGSSRYFYGSSGIAKTSVWKCGTDTNPLHYQSNLLQCMNALSSAVLIGIVFLFHSSLQLCSVVTRPKSVLFSFASEHWTPIQEKCLCSLWVQLSLWWLNMHCHAFCSLCWNLQSVSDNFVTLGHVDQLIQILSAATPALAKCVQHL